MSLWRRLFGQSDEPEPTRRPEAVEPPKRAEERSQEDERAERFRRLRRVGRPGGMEISEALALLVAHQGQAEQTPILDALLDGLGEGSEVDPIRVACASLLAERGERRRALELSEPSRSVAGMMLAAELHAQEGNLARALSMVERVLARDIDTPGARERHERWSAQLGLRPRAELANDGATIVAPAAAKASVFRILRELARGGAGTVYLAEDAILGRRLAYKVYHQARGGAGQVEREARHAVQLAGPGVLRIFDADPEAGWIAAELIERGSLRDVLKGGRVGELLPLARWFPALTQAVARVHDEGMVHGDIKPGNVLLRHPGDPLLSDFGICQRAGEPPLAGTPGYMSPERLEGAPADPRDDVYALGRIIEDVLGARDDADLPGPVMAESEAEARRYARTALACLGAAASRPPNAHRVAAALDADP